MASQFAYAILYTSPSKSSQRRPTNWLQELQLQEVAQKISTTTSTELGLLYFETWQEDCESIPSFSPI